MKTKIKFILISFAIYVFILYIIASNLMEIDRNLYRYDEELEELENQVFGHNIWRKSDPIGTQLLYADFVRTVTDYRISRSDFCAKRPNLISVIWAVSHPTATDQRKAIRQTWAKTLYSDESNIALVFILGSTSDSVVQKRVLEESSQFEDILQFGFIDSDHNRTLKSIGVLRWVHFYCSSIKFLVGIDDKYIIQVKTLANILRLESLGTNSKKILGIKGTNYKPDRNKLSKWYVSPETYEADHYPDFIYGPHIMTIDCVRVLYLKCLKTLPALWIDDVYMNGILVANTDIRLEDIRQIILLSIIMAYPVGYEQMYDLWNEYNQQLEQKNRDLRPREDTTYSSDDTLVITLEPEFNEDYYSFSYVDWF